MPSVFSARSATDWPSRFLNTSNLFVTIIN